MTSMHGHPQHAHTHAQRVAAHDTRGRLALAFALNAGFALIEVGGALWTGSVAIMADAVHDAGDALSLGFAWLLAGMAEKRGTPTFSYGYRRLTLLGALITAIVLATGSLGIMVEAVQRIQDPRQPYAPGMIGLALLGIAVNGFAALRLRAGKTLNERVVSWHLIEDILGWVAVLIGSLVMLVADVPVLDPLLSLAIAAFVLWNVIAKLRETMQLFLEGAPLDVSAAEVADRVASIRGVRDVHHLHVWSLDGERHLATAHVVIDAGSGADEQLGIRRTIHENLRSLGIAHATLEIEMGQDACLDAGAAGKARRLE